MSKLLEIDDLYVNYKTDEDVVYALNGFSLDVDRGETVGLVGETGAGKTTMALSLLRLLPDGVGEISKGTIVYDDTDILNLPSKKIREIRGSEISMIFQDPMTSLNPIIKIGEQVREVLHMHSPDMPRSEQDRRVDEYLSLVGIQPQRKDDYPFQFSGGMKQRVMIAMSLIGEPKLILADEPTTALDVTIQAQILVLMRELKEKMDSSMIFITHDLGIVAEFCDSIAVVYGGEVIERGSVDQVFSRKYNHPYTEGLFECIPDLKSTTKRLPNIVGTMLDPTNLPVGCKFASRCPKRSDSCELAKPEMYTVEEGHTIRCYNFEQKETE